jgi:glucose-1-phosphatase
MPYRAIFFDLGNVLVPFDLRRAYGALEAVSPLGIPEMASRLRSNGLVTDYECGRIEDEPFHAAICELLELDCDFQHFGEIWNSIFLPPTLVPESLLARLRGRYTLLLLSNTNSIHFRFLEQHYPHIAHFHHRTLSHEAGAQKPDAIIYQKALQQAGVTAGEAFFTDDLAENIEAARQIGIDAEQFTGVDALLEALQRRGILSGKG